MISKLPLVSVIIPVFNTEKYIIEALNSVINQTYKNIEIIAVDDASTDSSVKIISDFKDIKLIKLAENMGVGYARNIGIKESTGKFITFLDSDDFWVKEKLKIQIDKLLKDQNIGGVFGKFENFFEKKVEIPPYINKNSFLKPDLGRIKSLGTIMLRKSVFEKVGMFSEKIRSGEDIDWFFRAGDAGIKFTFYPNLLMYRRLHETNLSYSSLNNITTLMEILKSSIQKKREFGR